MQTAGQRAGKRSGQIFSEINITPLTDIFLVLLIIMMVVAPMMVQNRQDIHPPSVSNGSPVPRGKLTVEVTANGQYYLEGQAVPEDQLPAELQKHAAGATDKNVIIRADNTTRSGAVMRVMDAARDAQFQKVTVAGEALSRDRQQAL